MNKLTIIEITYNKNNREDLIRNKYIDIITTTEENIYENIKKSNSKYIMFINENDKISNLFNQKIEEVIKNDFDCCYINYNYNIDSKKNNKLLKNKYILKKYKPYYKDYIWSYIFDKEKLEKLLYIENEEDFNTIIDKEFINIEVIEEPIIMHNPYQSKKLQNFIYSDIKNIKKVNNIIYVENGCNGLFNGYITMIKNIGRCYADKFKIAILYKTINENTKKDFEELSLECLKNKRDTIYICDKLLVLYTCYFYPKNIVNLNRNYLIIQGNMSDYENTARYSDDIYTNYLAGTKTAALKAEGYYPTSNIEYIWNPYKLDKKLVKPRLKLVSTLRYSKIKCPERIEKMARLMDELEIPYTWEVFTDGRENTNINGLIFRKRTANPLPYVADSDYFVLLGNSEAFCYSVIEALSVNTKVVVTPLPTFEELDILDNYNTTVIPFEYFDDKNEEKLKEVIIKMYKEKDIQIDYKPSEILLNGYDEIFT